MNAVEEKNAKKILHVANATGYSVTEYAPGTSMPSFTCSFGMISPRAIAVDAQGHLFVSDFSGYNAPGRSSEYPQESKGCSPTPLGGNVEYLHSDGGAPLFVSIGKSNKHVYASIGRFYHSYGARDRLRNRKGNTTNRPLSRTTPYGLPKPPSARQTRFRKD